MEPTRYLFSGVDAVMVTFHVLDGKHMFQTYFRLALLIVLRALVHLIYLVFFNNFLALNFPFFKSSLIFDVVLHYQLNAFKFPKMV